LLFCFCKVLIFKATLQQSIKKGFQMEAF